MKLTAIEFRDVPEISFNLVLFYFYFTISYISREYSIEDKAMNLEFLKIPMPSRI